MVDSAFFALAAVTIGASVFYVLPLRKRFFEISGRERVFARRGEVLCAEKHVILENIDSGVITCDRDGRITYINQQARVLLHLKNLSILSKKVKEIAPLLDSDLFYEIDKLVDQVFEQKERTRALITLDEKEKAALELVAAPIDEGHGICIILKDRSNHHKVIEMGKEFIANASHELRTPITIIRGFAETLRDLPEISEEMFESVMGKIIRNCERIQVLVKNLLTLADLDSPSGVEMKECDLIDIVDDSCHTLLNIFPDAHIEQLQNDDHVRVWGDVGLLELAIFNLLKNAVKYSEGSAKIKITIDAGEESVEIRIQDQGIGIKKSELKKIFDRFYTVDKSHSRALGGAGLGLSIVKTIIEKHDGKIWATSEDTGSTFHIFLSRIQ